ncbi:unnamed protein product, partial [Nesidiocoris tenuis]
PVSQEHPLKSNSGTTPIPKDTHSAWKTGPNAFQAINPVEKRIRKLQRTLEQPFIGILPTGTLWISTALWDDTLDPCHLRGSPPVIMKEKARIRGSGRFPPVGLRTRWPRKATGLSLDFWDFHWKYATGRTSFATTGVKIPSVTRTCGKCGTSSTSRACAYGSSKKRWKLMVSNRPKDGPSKNDGSNAICESTERKFDIARYGSIRPSISRYCKFETGSNILWSRKTAWKVFTFLKMNLLQCSTMVYQSDETAIEYIRDQYGEYIHEAGQPY